MRPFALAIVAAFAAACAQVPPGGPDYELKDDVSKPKPSPSSAPTNAPSHRSPPADAGTTEPEAPPPDPDLTATYAGSLDATDPVNFAGAGCSYTVTLKNVTVSINTDKAGGVAGAMVRNRMVETTPGCDRPTAPANDHVYTIKEAVKTPAGWRVELSPGADNQPKAILVIDLTTTPDGFDASMNWQRYDVPEAGLRWSVRAAVKLAKQ